MGFHNQATAEETEMVFAMAEKWTGACHQGNYRRSILVRNCQERMRKCGFQSLKQYLEFSINDSAEKNHLLSALTIHTTSWFRELPHFQRFAAYLKSLKKNRIDILISAASSGEEAYSFALVCEWFRSLNPSFDYRVLARDIDTVSLEKGNTAIYSQTGLKDIPDLYKRFLLKGSGPTSGLFTLQKEIRERVYFEKHDIRKNPEPGQKFDVVICRNVLIYFSPSDATGIIQSLKSQLHADGILILGHCEAVESAKFGFHSEGNSIYALSSKKDWSPSDNVSTISLVKPGNTLKVTDNQTILVVDDSKTILEFFKRLLEKHGYKVVTAGNTREADLALQKHSVNLISLDLRMPGEGGAEWLKKIRSRGNKIPVILVSGASASEAVEVLGALESGAQDFLDKSLLHQAGDELIIRTRSLLMHLGKNDNLTTTPAVTSKRKIKPEFKPDAILIGASTGGTEAISRIVQNLPPHTPPVLIVQHIAPAFSGAFAQRLQVISKLELGANVDGEKILPGKIYVAGQDKHLLITGRKGSLRIHFDSGTVTNRHRPSVDMLFESAAELKQARFLAILLTGMGNDGAHGLLKLKNQGSFTCIQEEKSCVVYGMPKAAAELKAEKFTGDLEQIRDVLQAYTNE